MDHLVAVALIVLTALDGSEVTLSVDHITTLYETKEDKRSGRNELVAPGGRCVVTLANGRHYTVIEDCDTVRSLMQGVLPTPR
jgi:uncharacterized protein YlzI (FlbEa/FlbD family)